LEKFSETTVGYILVSFKTILFVAVGGRNRKVIDAYARNGGKRSVFSLLVHNALMSKGKYS